jgi:flavin-dependent dehydrogenase
MLQPAPDRFATETATTEPQYDAVIVGAGLGGIAAAIFLREAGARVMCIEPERFPHAYVGESLDWSTPALLKALGLPREQLIAEGVGFYKKKVRLTSLGKPPFEGGAHDWFQKRPLGFEVTTLHVDRVALDQRLFERAQALGVEFIWERVASVETAGDRVVAVQTREQQRITAKWYIDGSGQARLFAKTFGIPKVDYGRRKVTVWTYFNTESRFEGTSFYGDDTVEYLSWIWEIPITASTLSVGLIMPADEFEGRHRAGKSAAQILREELGRFERFAPLLAQEPDTPLRTCSYRCYVNAKMCGPNWVMVGEAASLPDPLTANGVTAAMRHAKDATEFIRASFSQGELSPEQMLVYDTNVKRMGHAFNYSIERCAYEPLMRWSLGSLVAMTVYTAFSYSSNAFYGKFNPQTPRSMRAFGTYFVIHRIWMESWTLIARIGLNASRLWPRPSRARSSAASTR